MVSESKKTIESPCFHNLINTTERDASTRKDERRHSTDCNDSNTTNSSKNTKRQRQPLNRGVDAFVVSFARNSAFFVGARSPRREIFRTREKGRTFSTNAAGRSNKEQGRGKGEGGQEEQQQQEEDDDDDEEQETIQTTTMLAVGAFTTRATRRKRRRRRKEYNSNNFYKVVVEEQYHLRHLRDGNQEYEKI